MSRESEMFGDLAEAVFAGDLIKAEATLDLMCASGQRSDEIMRAKRRARPGMRHAGKAVAAIPLPQPGVDAHTVFGGAVHYAGSSGRARGRRHQACSR